MSDIKGVPGNPGAAAAPAVAPPTQERAAPENERAFDEALAHGDELNEAQAPETRRAINRSLGRFATSKAADSSPSDASGQAEHAAPAGGGGAAGREATAAAPAEAEERAPADPSRQGKRMTPAGGGRQRHAVAGKPVERVSVPSGRTERMAPVGVARADVRGSVETEAVGSALTDPPGQAERVAHTGSGHADGRETLAREGVVGAPATAPTATAEGGPHRTALPISGPRDEIQTNARPSATTAAPAVGPTAADPGRTLGRTNPPISGTGPPTPSRPERVASTATGTPPGPVAPPRPRESGSRETSDRASIGSPTVAGTRRPAHGAPDAGGVDTHAPARGRMRSVGDTLRHDVPGGAADADPRVPGSGDGRPMPGVVERSSRASVEEETPPEAGREPHAIETGAAEVEQVSSMIAADGSAPSASSVAPAEQSPTRDVAATTREVVDRILVSVPQSGRSDEIRIGLNASVLDGSSIRIYREAGELRVVFEAPTEASQRFLAENQSVLRQTLAERLPGERVQLGVTTPQSGGLDRDDAEGRSRQRYIAEDTVEPDGSDVRNG
ncbi:MAG: hypothetical protein OXI79_08800 [Gammaproteobacteria bacterium]|nr:hypothetical protein [Gammaproteobacteria bacterium]